MPIRPLFKTVPDDITDEFGQQWCLGCGEFIFECECGYISWFERIRQRIRRPRIDVDPYYGPSPEYLRGDEPYCTYCTKQWVDCICKASSHFTNEAQIEYSQFEQ